MGFVARNLSRFTQREIDAFFKTAHRVLRHSGLVILAAPAQRDFGRILVITSRKVGSAPVRNKIRRRLKALFYQNNYYNHKRDYVVIVRKEGTELPFDQLRDLLARAIAQQS